MQIPKNLYSITSHKNHQHRVLRKKNVPLSFTRARELFLAIVTAVGIEREEFAILSLRSGGVSAAANAGVNGILVKSNRYWFIYIYIFYILNFSILYVGSYQGCWVYKQ